PPSDLKVLGAPNTEKIETNKLLAISSAVKDFKGEIIVNLENPSMATRKCLYPSSSSGNGPTVSTDNSSKTYEAFKCLVDG
ncbi:hypothetical protein ADUPG1_004962, partial [Aduncisulcus paluster]